MEPVQREAWGIVLLEPPDRADGLSPARGAVVGLLLGAGCWAALGLALWHLLAR
jgi:hypothetical protein